jgi:DNA polymerase I
LALLHHAVPNSKEKQVQPLNVVDPRVAKFMCGNDASVADIELQSIIQSFLQTEGGSCTTSIEVDDSQMHAMGRISRKVHVQLSLLRKLIPAYECLRRNLIETQSWNVFKDLEMPLVSVLTHMEFWGVAISLKALNCSADKLKLFMRHIEERVVGLVGEHRGQLNLQSPEQVARLLYEGLQLPRPAATSKSRHSSTSEKELNKLVHLHPVVDLILMYRSAAKVAGTYIDGVRPFILSVSDNCSIHACFNQTIASTGRLSCSRPNLQSIPKDCLDVARECALGSEVITESRISPRDFFLARSNCCLLSIDYSQVA